MVFVMKKLKFCNILFFVFFLIINACPSFLFSKGDRGKNRLNFLLITIDTLRPDRLSCYSKGFLETPNIDSLAVKGFLFLKAFAHTPTTLPSHTNILLGTTPLYHGVHDNSNFIVIEEFLTMAEHLKANGYATGAFVGAFPLDSRFGLTQGFDVYDDNYGGRSEQEFSYVERKAEVVVERALAWLEKSKSPWFLWIHCFDPHQRYDPPEPFKTQHKDNLYDGEVAYVDFALGKLFDFLEKNNYFQSTLVVFTGDHGESLGQHGESTHGYFAYNSTLWVPLIVYFPGIKPGQSEQKVAHIDIFPTACEILKVKKPPFLQGFSLLPVIKGKKLPQRLIYFESLYPYYSRGWAPLRGVVLGDEKYMDSPVPELYDLDKDFDESTNLASSKDLKDYGKKLGKLMEEQSIEKSLEQRQRVDREALERLRSLGYISSPQAAKKENFTPQDDLKVLLPYQTKLMKAMAAYHRGDFADGIKLLKEIIADRKDFDLAFSYLATLYKEQRKLRDAVEVLREGLEHNPSSIKIITTYGIFLAEVGQYDAAIEVLQKGLSLVDYDPEIWNYLGVAYWRKGDLEKAQEAYEKALSLDSNYPIVINNLGSLYLSRAIRNKSADDLQKAFENFKKAIEFDPAYASAYNGLGSAYGQTGNLDAAIECWEKSVELEPNLDFALYNLGLAYLTKGNKTKALSYLTQYKEKAYRFLSQKEKNKLDELIQRCK